MDETKVQSALQSRTVACLIGGLIAYLVKTAGLPMLPDDVSQELIDFISMILAAFIPMAMAAGIWFRVTARSIIGRWF